MFTIGKKFNHNINWKKALTGAAAIDKYNDPYPDQTHEICKEADSILFGAIGHPKYETKEFSFVPKSVEAESKPKFLNQICYGINLINSKVESSDDFFASSDLYWKIVTTSGRALICRV